MDVGFSVDLRQVHEASGIPFHILFYDARLGRLPATVIGKTYRLPVDVAAKIARDPDGYLAWRQTADGRRRQISYNGTVYDSVEELATALAITRAEARALIRRKKARYIANKRVFR